MHARTCMSRRARSRVSHVPAPGSTQVEPALAVDAGAGLKQMVALEREQMRQQLGLSKGPAADANGSSSVRAWRSRS